MSNLIVIGFEDSPTRAEELRTKLIQLKHEYLLELDDAVVVTKDTKGKIRLSQSVNTTIYGAISGSYWGCLIGLLFLSPLLGAAVGATSGAISGALLDVGINDKFMKDLAQTMQPNSSALFILARDMREERLLPELEGYGGRIIKTSLCHEDERRLQDALMASRAASV
ncbi:MAG: DUF1269 domain-containing protein [Candidatus Melainabacteria bacterium]|nr:DUF1269 domain-containing protein [Candidatus Melainabacteria bacterium]